MYQLSRYQMTRAYRHKLGRQPFAGLVRCAPSRSLARTPTGVHCKKQMCLQRSARTQPSTKKLATITSITTNAPNTRPRSPWQAHRPHPLVSTTACSRALELQIFAPSQSYPTAVRPTAYDHKPIFQETPL